MVGGIFDPLMNNFLKHNGTNLLGPNIPTTPPGGDMTGKPLSLLHGGDEDMRGALPMQGGPATTNPLNLGLVRATEGPSGQPPAAAPPIGPLGTATPPTDVAPGAVSGGPGLHPDTAPPDATIRAPYQTSTPAPAQAGISVPAVAAAPPPAAGSAAATPAAQPAAAGAGGGAATPPAQQSALGMLGDMGKALGAAGGGAASGGGSVGHAPGGMGGDPAAASRSGASALMESVMKANTPMRAGPVPGVQGLLQQRFRR